MRKLILIAHISLDGFVAGAKGELDNFPADEENLRFVCKLTEGADTALVGRKSYQLLDNYWPLAKDRPNPTKGEIAFSTWYNNVHKIVVSRTMSGVHLNNFTFIHENVL